MLEGEVRMAVAEFLDRFRRLRRGDDPHTDWHADFYDLYAELLGRDESSDSG